MLKLQPNSIVIKNIIIATSNEMNKKKIKEF